MKEDEFLPTNAGFDNNRKNTIHKFLQKLNFLILIITISILRTPPEELIQGRYWLMAHLESAYSLILGRL